MSDRHAKLLAIYNARYPDNDLDRDEAVELAGGLLDEIKQLEAAAALTEKRLEAVQVVGPIQE